MQVVKCGLINRGLGVASGALFSRGEDTAAVMEIAAVSPRLRAEGQP